MLDMWGMLCDFHNSSQYQLLQCSYFVVDDIYMYLYCRSEFSYIKIIVSQIIWRNKSELSIVSFSLFNN